MKKFLFAAMLAVAAATYAPAENLVILHTNDTHSQIDPADDGLGGLARRIALIDSVRGANPGRVLVVDAGDAVQGTLFFNVFGGEVENRALRMEGCDIAIVGNHDFDNGADSLARVLQKAQALFGQGPEWISTNYRFSPSSPLKTLFKPYAIREIDGHKVGFLGLNLVPKGMIAEGNYEGVEYLDAIKAANAMAWFVRNIEGAEAVVALSHLGYDVVNQPDDREVAAATQGIDAILGGHSHTQLVPGSGKEWVVNAAGKPVLVAQSGSKGRYLSEITFNLDSLASTLPIYRQFTVDKRYDGSASAENVEAVMAPYREGIEAEMSVPVATTTRYLDTSDQALLNFISDFIFEAGNQLAAPVDLAIMNKGSLRKALPKGTVTRGDIFTLQPFNNKIRVVELKGSDLVDALGVMALRGGDGVSSQGQVTFDPDTNQIAEAKINGQDIAPDRLYRIATIDYLANGGDYMEPLTRGHQVAESPNVIREDLLNHLASSPKHRKINPSSKVRMAPVR